MCKSHAPVCARAQFWYTEDTARTVARAVARAAGGGGAVACVACPSLFRALRASFADLRAQLLEYDARFQALGCFSQYDYCEPRDIPLELHGAFDVVVADPPYLVRASADAGRRPCDLQQSQVNTGYAHIYIYIPECMVQWCSEFSSFGWSMVDGCARQAAECLEKTALTIRLLARGERARLVLLTGAIMRPLAHDLLGLRCSSSVMCTC